MSVGRSSTESPSVLPNAAQHCAVVQVLVDQAVAGQEIPRATLDSAKLLMFRGLRINEWSWNPR